MITIDSVNEAANRIGSVVLYTPLEKNTNISECFNSNIWLKREDLQTVRSYKIRGAYNKMASLTKSQKKKGIVCASAGNHAQGVALSCKLLKIKGVIFMPVTTPEQKVNKVINFGKEFVDVRLLGDTFDEAQNNAVKFCKENKNIFIHPFDDEKIIEGQATVAIEILNSFKGKIDFLFVPIGGGGIASGVSEVFKELSPKTKIIGVEPEGAASMTEAFKQNKTVKLEKIDKFIDGAAVQKAGEKTFEICKKNIKNIVTIPEGKVCTTLLKLYNNDGIIVEPAGALSISALSLFKEKIKNKNVVCIVSGGNNDITRTEEIKERSLLYEGLKHYFIVRFPQRAGALREFVNEILGSKDDITFFEYSKKNSREKGPALIGLELKDRNDLSLIIEKMNSKNFVHEYLNEKQDLFNFLV